MTLLFGDIREFSRISELLAPAETMAWISDVMQEFSDCVLAHDGVLVDYIGDELMAMWGAPAAQPDHATLACWAAHDMLASLARHQRRWQARLGKPVRLGIGINTGVARVGNTGLSESSSTARWGTWSTSPAACREPASISRPIC